MTHHDLHRKARLAQKRLDRSIRRLQLRLAETQRVILINPDGLGNDELTKYIIQLRMIRNEMVQLGIPFEDKG